jgi:hypothetical protein
MGWLFGHANRKSLIDHLLHHNGVKTIKHCFVGNNLWTVQEAKRTDTGETVVFACLYKLSGPAFGRKTGDPYAWGYKDIDETMGPFDTSFPVAWLDLLSPIESPSALSWRAAVRARGEKIKSMTIGSKWRFNDGREFIIAKRRSPSSFLVLGAGGLQFKASTATLMRAERLESWTSESGTSTTSDGSAVAASACRSSTVEISA